MNNHKSAIITENGIEYHTLKFCSINRDDVKIIEKFIKKHKYVKITHDVNNKSEISYYKNNALHNDFGPSIIRKCVNSNTENYYYYYLNGVKICYNKWKNEFRKYKLLKLKNL